MKYGMSKAMSNHTFLLGSPFCAFLFSYLVLGMSYGFFATLDDKSSSSLSSSSGSSCSSSCSSSRHDLLREQEENETQKNQGSFYAFAQKFIYLCPHLIWTAASCVYALDQWQMSIIAKLWENRKVFYLDISMRLWYRRLSV